MRFTGHVLASGVVGAGIYAATGSLKMASVSFAAGVFLDLDHLMDYWENHSFNFNVSRFFNVCNECDLKTTKLFLHSAELAVIMTLAAYLTRSGTLAALTLGIYQHLALDQFFNKVNAASYVFIYRWSKGFRGEAVFNNLTTKKIFGPVKEAGRAGDH